MTDDEFAQQLVRVASRALVTLFGPGPPSGPKNNINLPGTIDPRTIVPNIVPLKLACSMPRQDADKAWAGLGLVNSTKLRDREPRTVRLVKIDQAQDPDPQKIIFLFEFLPAVPTAEEEGFDFNSFLGEPDADGNNGQVDDRRG